jgi:hypothetical protein
LCFTLTFTFFFAATHKLDFNTHSH